MEAAAVVRFQGYDVRAVVSPKCGPIVAATVGFDRQAFQGGFVRSWFVLLPSDRYGRTPLLHRGRP